MKTKNPTVLNTAAILLIVASFLNVIAPLIPNSDPAPAPVLYGSFAVGVLGLVTAFGLFRRQGWGIVLGFVSAALCLVLGVGPLTQGSIPVILGFGVALIVLAISVIALLALPSGRQAYAAK